MKNLIYSLTIISVFALLLLITSCGGDGVSSINTNNSPSDNTGSLKLEVVWPDTTGKELTASVIQPDVTQIEITITGSGLPTPRVETINKPETSKTITGLPAGDIQAEFKGKNTGGTVLSHRVKTVTIIKGQTVTTDIYLGVSIFNTGFYPQSISISPGDTLYWVNNDSVVHTVTADDGSFNSDTYFPAGIPPGGEYWHTFTGEGAFGYKCTKTGKAGSVVVGISPTPTVVPTPAMVSISGGTFNMGSNVNTQEQPVHLVTLSPFYIGKYEVTNAEYVQFLNSQGNQIEGGVTWIDMTDVWQEITGGPNPSNFTVIPGYENRPVVDVSWYGAVAYCNWLSTQHGLTPCYGPINNRGDDPSVWSTLNGYRLPTEAEWEYACRAGSIAEYYWGDPYPPDPPNIDNYAWYSNNAGGYNHDVGQKLPNSFGLYDMSGNVWEWCSDWYGGGYYAISPSNNPTGPTSGVYRVLRSGSWAFSGLTNYRSAFRACDAPDFRAWSFGFRLVRN